MINNSNIQFNPVTLQPLHIVNHSIMRWLSSHPRRKRGERRMGRERGVRGREDKSGRERIGETKTDSCTVKKQTTSP
jgi:hypothetical protein